MLPHFQHKTWPPVRLDTALLVILNLNQESTFTLLSVLSSVTLSIYCKRDHRQAMFTWDHASFSRFLWGPRLHHFQLNTGTLAIPSDVKVHMNSGFFYALLWVRCRYGTETYMNREMSCMSCSLILQTNT